MNEIVFKLKFGKREREKTFIKYFYHFIIMKKNNRTIKNKYNLKEFKKLAKKYTLITSGSRKQIAERINNLRGSYLSTFEKKMILPYLSKNNRILLIKKTRKKRPKI